jgi:hypothetical protein
VGGIVLKRGKSKYLEKNLSQCILVHYKSHAEYPAIEPGLSKDKTDVLTTEP